MSCISCMRGAFFKRYSFRYRCCNFGNRCRCFCCGNICKCSCFGCGFFRSSFRSSCCNSSGSICCNCCFSCCCGCNFNIIKSVFAIAVGYYLCLTVACYLECITCTVKNITFRSFLFQLSYIFRKEYQKVYKRLFPFQKVLQKPLHYHQNTP